VSDDNVGICKFVAVFAVTSASGAALHIGQLRHQFNMGRVAARLV
jgi:hypothetical protein